MSLTATVAMTSLPPSMTNLLALRFPGLSCIRLGLPDGEDVSLGVGQLGEPPHPRHRVLAHEDLGPEPLRFPDELVHIGHVDVVDGGLARKHAPHEPTVDPGTGG